MRIPLHRHIFGTPSVGSAVMDTSTNTVSTVRLDNILLPTDLTFHAAYSGEYAAELARVFDAEVHVFHVVKGGAARLKEEEDSIREEVDRWSSRIDLGGVDYRKRWVAGEPFEEIQQYIHHHRIDLCVVAARGETELDTIFLGTHWGRVVSEARCPVLSVNMAVATKLDQEKAPIRFSKILWPTDFSVLSKSAWAYVLLFAKKTRARVYLLNVIENPAFKEGEVFPQPLTPEELVERKEAAQAKAEEFMTGEECGPHGVEILIRDGKTGGVISGTAKEIGADLIVLATRGETDISQTPMGSVSHHVVRAAPCPVITVRAPSTS